MKPTKAAIKNIIAYNHYYDGLAEIAMSVFEWKGLPEPDPENGVLGCDPVFLEKELTLGSGHALYFEDDVMGQLVLPCALEGRFDVYGKPIDREVIACNGYHAKRTPKNSVVIYNNYLKTSCVPLIDFYARKLAEIDRSMDVNIKQQKTPMAILCDEKQRVALMNLYKQYDGNEPVIFGDKTLNTNMITTINTGAEWKAQKLYDLKSSIIQEALSRLGVPNSQIEKRERVNAAEVQANTAGTIAMRYSRLAVRQFHAKEISKMFNREVECNFRDDLTAQIDAINDDLNPKPVDENSES